MAHLIDKDAVIAEINALLDDKFQYNSYDEETGFQNALFLVKKFLDTLEVKEVDLDEETDLEYLVKEFCYEFDDRKDKWYEMTPHNKNIMTNPTWSNFAMQLAKHFFELGLSEGNKTQKGE